MACKRTSDQFLSYGHYDDDELELSDDEQWSRPRTALGHYRQSTILDLPLKRQRLIYTAVCKPNQQEISSNDHELPQSSFRHSRTIIHIDIDCFYAQVEMVRNPQLREVPLGIQQKNIVVTCNYVARKHGIKKLVFVSDAKKKCPDLVLVNGEDLTTYREFSAKVHALLTREFTPLVERLGMDENFLDVTELVKSRLLNASPEQLKLCGFKYGQSEFVNAEESRDACSCGCHERLVVGSVIAMEIREAIFQETGLTSCAGVSYCKLLAKLVGSYKKPNEQTTIFPENAEKLLTGLQAREIPGIGHSIAKKLRTMNISSVPEVRSCPQKLLEDEFGSLFALAMIKWCHGVDDSEVIPSGEYKSISDEDSFKKCSTFQDVKNRLNNLIEGLLPRITDDVGMPRTIRLTVRRYAPHSHKRESRQCSLPHSFAFSNQEQKATSLLVVCMDLFSKVIDVQKPFHLTLLGVSLTNFQKSNKAHSKTITSFFQKKTAKSEEISPNLNYDDIATKDLQHEREHIVEETKFISHSNQSESLSERCVAGCEHMVDVSKHSGSWRSKEMEKEDQTPICCHINQGHDNSLLNCPDGVDPTVFAELPLEVQQELQAHWNKTGKRDAHSKKRNPKMTTGIVHYFSRM